MKSNVTKILAGTSIFAGACLAASAASAADPINYTELFRTKAIKCLHGTVNPDKATVEITKPAEKSGEVTTVRVKAFYDGLVRKNTLEAELMIREAGSIRQMRIKTLSDSAPSVSGCDLEKGWKDF